MPSAPAITEVGDGRQSIVDRWAGLAFSCNSDRVRLRCLALSANAVFIAYGLTRPLWPVLALHFERTPITAWRPWQTLLLQRERRAQEPAAASP
jgi:hypothetical protein